MSELHDIDTMEKCHGVVSAMLRERLEPDAVSHWWKKPAHALAMGELWRSPADALLDGDGPDVYRFAENWCYMFDHIKLKKAGRR